MLHGECTPEVSRLVGINLTTARESETRKGTVTMKAFKVALPALAVAAVVP
jgi:hypothetical protein